MRRLCTLATLVAAGCGANGQLEPTPSAPTTVGEDLAVEQVDGVTIKAETDDWPGELEVLLYVTPVRMTLTNNSDHPVRLRYPLFQLVTPDGRRFAALPPFKIEGTIESPVIVYPIDSFEPELYHRRFVVSPLYSNYYPGISVWNRPFYYDFDYYDYYYAYWLQPLPTLRMVELALPEGVLQPGGEITGYLYFEKIKGADRATLRVDVIDADNGTRVGSSAILFDVQG